MWSKKLEWAAQMVPFPARQFAFCLYWSWCSLEENNALVLHCSSLKVITLIFYSVQLYNPSFKEIEVKRPLHNHLVSNNTGNWYYWYFLQNIRCQLSLDVCLLHLHKKKNPQDCFDFQNILNFAFRVWKEKDIFLFKGEKEENKIMISISWSVFHSMLSL